MNKKAFTLIELLLVIAGHTSKLGVVVMITSIGSTRMRTAHGGLTGVFKPTSVALATSSMTPASTVLATSSTA